MYKVIVAKGMFHVFFEGKEVANFKSFIRLAEYLVIEDLLGLSVEGL